MAMVLAALTPAKAAETEGVELVSEFPLVYDDRTREVVATGEARLFYGDWVLRAQEIRFNQETGLATASGGVVVSRDDFRLVGDLGRFWIRERRLELENFTVGDGRFYLRGQRVEGTLEELTFSRAELFRGEPHGLALSASVREAVLIPGDRVRARGVTLRIGAVPFFHVPSLNEPLDGRPRVFRVGAGFQSDLGAILTGEIRLPVAEGLEAGGAVELMTKRGLLLGPRVDYELEWGEGVEGTLQGGWIRDRGDRGVDLLGRSVPRQRGFVEWRHWQDIGGGLDLAASLSYWSDSAVVRDFRRSRFRENQDPESFAEARWATGPWAVTLFTRVAPGDFQVVPERLPELRADLLPTPLGGGLWQQAYASAGRLREKPPAGGAALRADRLDFYYGLQRPWTPGPGITLIPVAGTRVIRTTSAGLGETGTRWLGELGLDASLRAERIFPVENELWRIDGIRHIFEPRLEYRYQPELRSGPAGWPAMDRPVFRTHLEPLGLDRIRSIDTPGELHTARLVLDNRIQTRSRDHGSRDLARISLGGDLRFSPRPGERDFSWLHLLGELYPADWLTLEGLYRYDPEVGALQEAAGRVTVRDGDHWTASLGGQYLRRQLQQYDLFVETRITEVLRAFGGVRYDVRARRFNETVVGLRQNLRQQWLLSYEVGFLEGPRREGSFQFRIGVDFLGF
ncbi:MAG: LPS-assembly protein LptD [Puniceicoccaceae bacterium]|nr:MAG: LPS-assembly protein LptD [Puniceicoccaceae bacterium]